MSSYPASAPPITLTSSGGSSSSATMSNVAALVGSIVVIAAAVLLMHPTLGAPSVTKVLATHKITEQGATLGNPNAPVTLVDFIDLECGPAATYHREVMPTIIDRYVKTGKVKVMLVDLGDEGSASRSAQQVFTRFADKNLAWEWTDQMFKIPKGPKNSRSMTEPYVAGLVANIPSASMADLGDLPDSAGHAARERSQAWAMAVGAPGTPSLAVGASAADRSTYSLVRDTGQHIPSLAEVETAINEQEVALGHPV